MRLAFIGSNPSKASAGRWPFMRGTKSGDTVNKWIIEAGLVRSGLYLEFYNIVDHPTENNRALTKSEIIDHIPSIKSKLCGCWKVVALGKTASAALVVAGIPHLSIDHPSGLNRKLNDRQYVDNMIHRLREYAK